MKKNKILLTILTTILLLAGCDSSSSIDSGLSSSSDNSSSTSSFSSEDSSSSSSSSSSTSKEDSSSSSSSSSSISSSSNSSDSSSTSSGSSSGEIGPDIPTSVKYDIQYDLGTRTTAVQLKNADDIYNTFYTTSSSNIIESIEGFEYIYGGGNGGSGATKWYSSDILKFGTTSKFGSLTFKLNQDVKGVKISGYIHKAATAISVGDASSSMWNESETSDKKITNVTLSDLNVASLDVVNNKDIKTMEVSFDNTRNLKIAVTKNGPLYLTSIEFITTVVKKYDVTWKNYDGTILKIDNDVPSGETPKYNGITPTKDLGDGNEYIFAGWTPNVGPIEEDTVYTARFVLKGEAIRPSGEPIKNGQYIEYGYYPQNHVKDNDLLSILDSLPLDLNGWTLYDGKYYVKTKSNIYNNETYKFDDGSLINNETDYWFECETIKWNILSSENNQYLLVSNLLLESMCFYKDCFDRTINNNTIFPNSYEYSDIRSYLNNEFLNKAFFLNNTHLIENSSSFNDKISLLSKDDCLNENYGFSSSLNLDSNRTCKVSEYARSSGSWMSKDNNNGSYWTKTSSNDFSYACYNINSGGVLSEYAVDSASHSIRPLIIISL